MLTIQQANEQLQTAYQKKSRSMGRTQPFGSRKRPTDCRAH